MPLLNFFKKNNGKPGAMRSRPFSVRREDRWLIVGLGNPGVQYEHTRHNVGFDCIDILAEENRLFFNRHMCRARVGEGRIGDRRVVLAKPDTFMNLSGEAVAQLARFYKIPSQQILVIYDDLDLPFGALRIRKSGGPGTHNGMRNIVACLNTEDFPRVRVGIGAPPKGWDIINYVMGRVPSDQKAEAAAQHKLAAQAAQEVILSGLDAAMQKFNTKRSK